MSSEGQTPATEGSGRRGSNPFTDRNMTTTFGKECISVAGSPPLPALNTADGSPLSSVLGSNVGSQDSNPRHLMNTIPLDSNPSGIPLTGVQSLQGTQGVNSSQKTLPNVQSDATSIGMGIRGRSDTVPAQTESANASLHDVTAALRLSPALRASTHRSRSGPPAPISLSLASDADTDPTTEMSLLEQEVAAVEKRLCGMLLELAQLRRRGCNVESLEGAVSGAVGCLREHVPDADAESKPDRTSSRRSSSARPSGLIGLCNPMLDMSLRVEAEYLSDRGLAPDGWAAATDELMEIFDHLSDNPATQYIPGGSGMNTLRVAQWCLDQPGATTFVGTTGRDDAFGRRLRKATEAEGVAFPKVELDGEPTGTCAVLLTGDSRSLVANLGAGAQFRSSWLTEMADLRTAVRSADIYYATGFFLRTSPETVMELGAMAAERGKEMALNISAAFVAECCVDLFRTALPRVDILFGNAAECAALAKALGLSSGDDVRADAAALRASPKESGRPRVVVVTRGPDVVVVAEAHGVASYDTVRVAPELVVDTNGAGDAFAGGFLARRLDGGSVAECVRTGQWAATVIIGQTGCTLPTAPAATLGVPLGGAASSAAARMRLRRGSSFGCRAGSLPLSPAAVARHGSRAASVSYGDRMRHAASLQPRQTTSYSVRSNSSLVQHLQAEVLQSLLPEGASSRPESRQNSLCPTGTSPAATMTSGQSPPPGPLTCTSSGYRPDGLPSGVEPLGLSVPGRSSLRSTGTLLGLCNPLLDMSLRVDTGFLDRYGLEPNGWTAATDETIGIFPELAGHGPGGDRGPLAGEETEYLPGGSGMNTLRVAQWILDRPGATTFFGTTGADDFAKRLRKATEAEGVRFPSIEVDALPTGTCAVLLTGEERSLVANLGASAVFDAAWIRDRTALRHVADSAGAYYVTGFFLRTSPDTVDHLARLAVLRERDLCLNLSAPFVCEGSVHLFRDVLPRVDVLFGNRDEAAALVKAMGTDPGTDTAGVARRLQQLPKASQRPRTVVITQGAGPVIVATEDGVVTYETKRLPPEQIVDTNGAGDAFAGGFLARRIQLGDVGSGTGGIAECVRMGQWTASIIIGQSGCTLPPFPAAQALRSLSDVVNCNETMPMTPPQPAGLQVFNPDRRASTSTALLASVGTSNTANNTLRRLPGRTSDASLLLDSTAKSLGITSHVSARSGTSGADQFNRSSKRVIVSDAEPDAAPEAAELAEEPGTPPGLRVSGDTGAHFSMPPGIQDSTIQSCEDSIGRDTGYNTGMAGNSSGLPRAESSREYRYREDAAAATTPTLTVRRRPSMASHALKVAHRSVGGSMRIARTRSPAKVGSPVGGSPRHGGGTPHLSVGDGLSSSPGMGVLDSRWGSVWGTPTGDSFSDVDEVIAAAAAAAAARRAAASGRDPLGTPSGSLLTHPTSGHAQGRRGSPAGLGPPGGPAGRLAFHRPSLGALSMEPPRVAQVVPQMDTISSLNTAAAPETVGAREESGASGPDLPNFMPMASSVPPAQEAPDHKQTTVATDGAQTSLGRTVPQTLLAQGLQQGQRQGSHADPSASFDA